MKVLIVPMAAMAETGGPSSRCSVIAKGLMAAGHNVATCMAEDINFRKIESADNYFLDVPMPMGLPKFIATRTFPIAQKLGITARKEVKSFDQVLRFTGNLDYGYLKKSVESIRTAIRRFTPDVVYSEFNISALIAARLEGVKLFASTSYPTQHEYANDPKLASGLNRLLAEYGLPKVDSALQLIDLSDHTFCPSIFELEPLKRENLSFCGALKKVTHRESKRDKILVYMGNGTISADNMFEVVRGAFKDSEHEVYIASGYLQEMNEGNIHVAPRWDFNTLLDEAVLFINHGGQNSIVDGLLHGVPQISVPGRVFERRYNAASIQKNGCGVVLPTVEFMPNKLRECARQIIKIESFSSNAKSLGEKLSAAGGVDVIIKELKQ